MSTQDDIREHADYVTEYLQIAVELADEIERMTVQLRQAQHMAGVHMDRIKALKPAEPVRCEDAVRASLADSYVRDTA